MLGYVMVKIKLELDVSVFQTSMGDRLQKALLSQMSENQKANRDRAICTTEEKVVCRLRLVLNFYK
jgi:hypothetical protein